MKLDEKYFNKDIVNVSIAEFEKGVKYLEENNIYNMFVNFQIPQKWHLQESVECLDEFQIRRETFIEINGEKDQQSINRDLKWGLLDIINTGSCAGAAVFIYQMFVYVQMKEKNSHI